MGETSDIAFKLNLHNQHAFQNSYPKMASDWELVISFECPTKAGAVYLERFIKRMKSKKFIKKVVFDTPILSSILTKKK